MSHIKQNISCDYFVFRSYARHLMPMLFVPSEMEFLYKHYGFSRKGGFSIVLSISNVHERWLTCEGSCLDDLALVTERSPRGCPAEGAGTKGDEGNVSKQFIESQSHLRLRITAREYRHRL